MNGMRDKAIDTRGRTMSDMKELTTAVNEVAILLKIPEEEKEKVRERKSKKKKRTNHNTYIKPSVTSNTLSLRANSRNFVKRFENHFWLRGLHRRDLRCQSTTKDFRCPASWGGFLSWAGENSGLYLRSLVLASEFSVFFLLLTLRMVSFWVFDRLFSTLRHDDYHILLQPQSKEIFFF